MEEIILKNFGPQHSFMASLYNGRGQIYRQMGNFQKALPNYQKALEVYGKVRGKSHPGNMNYLNNISASYLGINNYEMAIHYLHKSLAISLALNKTGIRGSPIDSRDALFGMGQVFYDWYMHDNDIQKLDSSKYYFDEGIGIMEDIRENRAGSLITLLTTEFAFNYLSTFNEVCDILDKKKGDDLLSSSYKTLEKFRAMDLRSSFLQKYQDASPGNPLISLENQLIKVQSHLLKLKSKDQNILDSNNSLNKKQTIEDSLFLYQQIKDSLMLALKEEDPKSYAMRYDLGVKSVKEIQQNLLKPNEAIVQFQWHESNIYTFVITQTTFDLTKVPSTEVLASEITKFKSAISNRDGDLLQHQKIIGDLLFDKSLELLPSEIDHLIIIPDGQIHLVPMEVLRPSILGNEMLISRYRISHAISSSMLFHQTHASKGKGKLLSVAPRYPDNPGTEISPVTNELLRAGELHLPFASKEAKAISDEVNGDVLLGFNASKENFLKKSSDYSVLHLAMHAILLDKDPQSSHLLFPPLDSIRNSLYIHEINTLKLEKELVILSACNTALGTIHNGDAVKGISYAFYQSGTRSTITSLWKVPDQATQKIMVQFYQHLKNGNSKSESLRQAKLDYLASVGSELEKHPFYWAGFILTGSDSSIEFVSSGYNKVLIGVMLLILLIGLFGFVYKKRKHY
jgi:CHAT domain-containing protein